MDAVVNLAVIMAILSLSISLGLVFERTLVRGVLRLIVPHPQTRIPGTARDL
jgi:hypothetical protein